ncbi:MAG TPA: sigma-70 family RNA polymerase sigma factor [Actinomycetota bacterium]|jgi:RNA polymerase sigma-70 factor (ECF subfamily)
MRDVTLPIEARTLAADFESFFRAEYRSLCQALVLLVGDALEAEDIAQETMTRVLERWDRVGVMESPAGYAYRTALNLQRKRIRRLAVRRKRRFASVPVPDIATAASDQHDVRRALHQLPDGMRAALILVDWLDMDTEEAGRVLEIKPASVRVRLHRARSALRDALGETS